MAYGTIFCTTWLLVQLLYLVLAETRCKTFCGESRKWNFLRLAIYFSIVWQQYAVIFTPNAKRYLAKTLQCEDLGWISLLISFRNAMVSLIEEKKFMFYATFFWFYSQIHRAYEWYRIKQILGSLKSDIKLYYWWPPTLWSISVCWRWRDDSIRKRRNNCHQYFSNLTIHLVSLCPLWLSYGQMNDERRICWKECFI